MRYKLMRPMTSKMFDLIKNAVEDANGEGSLDDADFENIADFLKYDIQKYEEAPYLSRIEKLFGEKINVTYSDDSGMNDLSGFLKYIDNDQIGILTNDHKLTMIVINSTDGSIETITDEDDYVVFDMNKYIKDT